MGSDGSAAISNGPIRKEHSGAEFRLIFRKIVKCMLVQATAKASKKE